MGDNYYSDLFERLLPGYRIVCRIFARYFGIDLTNTLTYVFVIYAVTKGIEYAWRYTSRIFRACLTCSITVPGDDGVCKDVLGWVSENVLASSGIMSGGTSALTLAPSSRGFSGGKPSEKREKLSREFCFNNIRRSPAELSISAKHRLSDTSPRSEVRCGSS